MSPTPPPIDSGERLAQERRDRPPGLAPPAPGPADDAALLAGLRDERTVPSALEAIYTDHAPPVRARLRRAGLDADLAEDVVQEAVIQLWEARASLPTRLRVRAWLAVVAGRRAVDAIRQRHRRHRSLDEVCWPTAASDDPVQIVLQHERRRQVGRLLALLDPDERRLIALLYRDGARQATVAARLGRSLAALTSWAFRVRRYLAAAWLALEAGRQPPPRRRLTRRDDR